MARIRSIKPEFWIGDDITECSMPARLLFIGLWNFADDQGGQPASIKKIKAQVFPMDDISWDDVRRLIAELEQNDQLKRYAVDGKDYLQIIGWHHQKIDRPQKAKFPRPEDADMQDPKAGPRTVDEGSPLIGEDRIGEDRIGRAVDEPPPIEDPPDVNPKGETYAYSGNTVRLLQNDYDSWVKAFPYLDLRAELQSRDDWYRENPDKAKGWYTPTSAWLRNRNQMAFEKRRQQDGNGSVITERAKWVARVQTWWNGGAADGIWLDSYGTIPGTIDSFPELAWVHEALGEDYEAYLVRIPEGGRRS